ncbi:hypothetical protein FCN80_03820 [Martelella alba]|uniref:Flagellar hook-length control protein-like C-terminal domain-containing protein n=2 Tax=Martelella alba TaxID=2590451 RepID=A0ABY2SVA3_9HYPH|nr:hypothetical protein FCN80_03820 [Martelella alba]
MREERQAAQDTAVSDKTAATGDSDAQQANAVDPGKATTQQQTGQPDPALDGNAAQALMALLAQAAAGATTGGAVADSAASGGTVGANDKGGAGVNALTAAAVSAAGNSAPQQPDIAAASGASTADGATANAAKRAIPAVLPAGAKAAAGIVDTGQKDKTASDGTADKNAAKTADTSGGAASTAQTADTGGNTSTVGGPTQTAEVPTFTLKKAAVAVMDETSSSRIDAQPAATPSLSAAGTSAGTTPTPASALISAQLGSDEWQQAIGQQVIMYSRNGQQNAELRLHPESLGTVQISLQVDTNNQMQIHLASGHSQVRAALEDALPQLRAALAGSGINLGQSSVGGESMPNWTASGQDTSTGGRSSDAFTLNAIAGTADNGIMPTASAVVSRNIGIDTFA